MSVRSIYGDVVLDHYRNPRNRGTLLDADAVVRARNPICGDVVELYLELDGSELNAVRFEGTGCAISQASTSLMTESVAGHSRAEAERLLSGFLAMLAGESPEDGLPGGLQALSGVSELPDRVQCAALPWQTLERALELLDSGCQRDEISRSFKPGSESEAED